MLRFGYSLLQHFCYNIVGYNIFVQKVGKSFLYNLYIFLQIYSYLDNIYLFIHVGSDSLTDIYLALQVVERRLDPQPTPLVFIQLKVQIKFKYNNYACCRYSGYTTNNNFLKES